MSKTDTKGLKDRIQSRRSQKYASSAHESRKRPMSPQGRGGMVLCMAAARDVLHLRGRVELRMHGHPAMSVGGKRGIRDSARGY